MKLSYVKLFADTSGAVDLLSDAEAGRLFKAILHGIAGEVDELPGQEKLVYAMLKAQFERDADAYEQYSEKQRENGKKGGRPKKPSGFSENPKNPTVFSETQKSQDKDKDKDKDKDEEKDSLLCVRFDDFWAVYPNKVKKKDAMAAWRTGKCDKVADRIIADVKLRRDTEWNGQEMHYVPHPTTYLHQRRWEDETPPQERREKTVLDRNPQANPALNYDQRKYSNDEFDESFFVDLSKYD